jgi:hypothetical protein
VPWIEWAGCKARVLSGAAVSAVSGSLFLNFCEALLAYNGQKKLFKSPVERPGVTPTLTSLQPVVVWELN